MLRYKIKPLEKLIENGYTTYKLRTEKHFSEGVIQKFRNEEVVSIKALNELCKLLKCQPGDILEYVED